MKIVTNSTVLFLLTFLTVWNCNSQDLRPFCANDSLDYYAKQADPDYLTKQMARDAFYKFYKENAIDNPDTNNPVYPQYRMAGAGGNGILPSFVIPVVFIQLYNGTPNAQVTPTRIQSTLDLLNNRFQSSNISFCYATKYPNGTSLAQVPGFPVGFLRETNSLANNFPVSAANLLQLTSTYYSMLPSSNYLKIYIVDNIPYPTGIVGGFATSPGSNLNFDAIVMRATAIGSASCGCYLDLNWNEGEALVHETGHFLNLKHVFEGGCTQPNNDPLLDGDGVSDTDPQDNSGGWLFSICSTASPQLCPPAVTSNNFLNFMDYKSDACKTQFTAGQISRMHTCLLNDRSSLVSAQNLLNTGIACTGNNPVILISNTPACRNSSVSFSIAGATPQSYSWAFGDGGTSTLAAPTYSYLVNGTYTVSITVTYTGGIVKTATAPIAINDCPDIDCKKGNWYFGFYAGVKFQSGSLPQADYGAYNNLTLNWSEGTGTMSDNSCNLLFYTDGNTIWNGSHASVVTGLGANSSAMQAALVVPWVGHTNQYFVFGNNSANLSGTGGAAIMKYIRVTANAGNVTPDPLGIQNLSAPTQAGTHFGEGLTAISNCDETGYWVFASVNEGGVSDRILVYLINSTGITLDHTITLPTASYWTYLLKFSPDGGKLAHHLGGNTQRIYDFDRSTGMITNLSTPILIDMSGLNNSYGMSFSPNSKVFYNNYFATSYLNVPIMKILQYDLTSPNPSANRSVIAQYNGQAGGLQLGPDDKIYAAVLGGRALSVINYPNLLQNQNVFQPNSVPLNTLAPNIQSQYGLPNLIDAKAGNQAQANFSYVFTSCYTVSFKALACASSYLWNFGDGTATSSLQAPSHTYANPGVYTIRLTINGGPTYTESTVTIGMTVGAAIVGTTSVCTNTLYGNYSITASAYGSPLHYNWSVVNGTILSFNNQSGVDIKWNTGVTTGTVNVTVTNNYGCSATRTLNVTFTQPPAVATNNGPRCLGQPITLTATGGVAYSWSPSAGLSCSNCANPIITNPTASATYTVTVTGSNACSSTASTNVSVTNSSPPTVNAGADITTCGNSILLENPPSLIASVSGGASPYSYKWTDQYNSIVCVTQTFIVNQLSSTSTYTLSVTDANGCSNSDQVIANADPSCCSFGVFPVGLPPVISKNYYNINSNSALFPNLNSATPVTNLAYCFNGTTTINNSGVTFANQPYLAFGGNAKIYVNPSYSLTVSGCTLQMGNGTCSNMWQGIELADQTSMVTVQKHATTLTTPLIMDAKNAILSHKGGTYIISDCKFDRNWIDIYVDGQYNSLSSWGDYTSSSVKRCRFFCSTTLPASTPTPSYLGQRTSSAIYITDAINVKIGSTLVGDSNIFGNNVSCTNCGINNGIYTLRSAVDVYYNRFENIRQFQTGGFASTITNGTGIYTEAPCLYPPNCTMLPGQSHSIYLNWSGYSNNTVLGSANVKNVNRALYNSQVQMTATDQCLANADIGIEVANCKNKVMNVLRNYFYQSKYGISFATPQATSIAINDNYMELLTPPNNTSLYYGINLNEDINLNTTTINVLRNNISNGMIGIQVSNAKLQACSLSNNYIKVWHPTTSGVNYPVNGISLTNCQNILVNNNKVYDLVTNWINQYNTYNSLTWAANVKGIVLYNSGQGVRLLCNHTQAINYGFAFCSTNGTNAVPVNLYHNLMEYHKYGVVLSNANGASGEIGHQGMSGFLSNGNEFGFASGNITHTLSVSSNNINNSQIFYRTGTNEGPISATFSGPNSVLLGGSAIPAGSAYVTCAEAIPMMMSGGGGNSSMAQKLELDAEQLATEEAVVENNQDFEEVKNWMNQRHLYKKLEDNSELVAESSELQTYLEEKQVESIGQSEDFSHLIEEVNEVALHNPNQFADKLTEASEKNEQIVDGKLYESAQKAINTLYLNKLNRDGVSDFSVEEKQQISYLAHQCVYTYGNAVYLARALYSLEHPEEIMMDYLLCANSYKNEEETLVGERIIDVKIIPNPADQKVLVVCDLRGYEKGELQITDITGHQILSQSLNTGVPITEINTSQLAAGIYSVRIIADQQLINGKKIVIAH